MSLLCAVPNALMAELVMGSSLTGLGVLREPILPKDGLGLPPRRPGHGVEFDEAALARCALP